MLKTLNSTRPIGKQLKTSSSSSTNGSERKPPAPSSLSSLELQILALEEQLGNSSDSDSDTSFTVACSDESVLIEDDQEGIVVKKDKNGNTVKIESSLLQERIAPLSSAYLPSEKCKTSVRSSEDIQKSNSERAERKRKVSFVDESSGGAAGDVSPSTAQQGNLTNNMGRKIKRGKSRDDIAVKQMTGLEATVLEHLRHYKPASHEKLPFFCRVCRFKGGSVEDLERHRMSAEHASACELERKMSFCKLCRKQFTSPDQLKGHLTGKSHIERLAKMKLQQSGGGRLRGGDARQFS